VFVFEVAEIFGNESAIAFLLRGWCGFRFPMLIFQHTRTPSDVYFGCTLNVNFRVNFERQGLPWSLRS